MVNDGQSQRPPAFRYLAVDVPVTRHAEERNQPNLVQSFVSEAHCDVMRRQGDGTWRFVIDNPYGAALGESLP